MASPKGMKVIAIKSGVLKDAPKNPNTKSNNRIRLRLWPSSTSLIHIGSHLNKESTNPTNDWSRALANNTSAKWSLNFCTIAYSVSNMKQENNDKNIPHSFGIQVLSCSSSVNPRAFSNKGLLTVKSEKTYKSMQTYVKILSNFNYMYAYTTLSLPTSSHYLIGRNIEE